jgi:hypothetical protein
MSDNPVVHWYPVSGKDHFSVLAPVTRLLAEKILHDTGDTTNITIGAKEL